MAMQPAIFQWGPLNSQYFGTAAPTLAGEGPFKVGDVIFNTAPAAAGVYMWVCTTAGTGATAVWKTLTLSA